MKKYWCFAIAIGCLIASYVYLSKPALGSSPKGYCAFCDTDVLNRQKFYEDDLIIALYTYQPILPGHCLIIPKRHVERFDMLSEDEIAGIGRVIKKVHHAASKVFNTSSYLILQKNGLEVGQSVPHVHFHYIPRKKGDDGTLKILVKMYMLKWHTPLSATEMQPLVDKMKEAMISEGISSH